MIKNLSNKQIILISIIIGIILVLGIFFFAISIKLAITENIYPYFYPIQ